MNDVDLVVVEPTDGVAATCVVCGKEVPAGTGVTARYRGQTLRFKCPGCLTRFQTDPDRYLSGGPAPCCDDDQERGGAWTSGAFEAPTPRSMAGDDRRPSLRLLT